LWDDVNHVVHVVVTTDSAANAIFSLLQTLPHEHAQHMSTIVLEFTETLKPQIMEG